MSTRRGASGWSTGCLVLSSVRGLQMNVCRINGAQRLVERSHECTRRSDQKISMHTRRSYRVWMGLSPSIELNHANGKSVCMPRRIAQKPQRIVTSPALRRKSSSQQTAAVESAPNGALYLRKSLRVAASGGASEATGEWAGERSAADASLGGANMKKKAFTASSAQSRSRPLAGRDFVTTGYLTPLTARPTRGPAPRTDGWLPSHGRLAALPPLE